MIFAFPVIPVIPCIPAIIVFTPDGLPVPASCANRFRIPVNKIKVLR